MEEPEDGAWEVIYSVRSLRILCTEGGLTLSTSHKGRDRDINVDGMRCLVWWQQVEVFPIAYFSFSCKVGGESHLWRMS